MASTSAPGSTFPHLWRPSMRGDSIPQSSGSRSPRSALRDLVVGPQDEDRLLRLHPELHLAEELTGDALDGVAHGLRGIEAPLFGGIVVVGALQEALLDGGGALVLGDL